MAVKELLAQFHEIAANPKKQFDKYIKDGKKVVLCAPVYTPNEIIHSMGLVPMGAWGGDLQINESKKYYPAFICSIMQTLLELGIKGEFDGASAIVIPSLCDSLKTLGQNWKYAVKGISFIPMNYPQNRKPDYGIAYTKAGYDRIITDLKAATGQQYSHFALQDSIDLYNMHNEEMRKFADLAADHKVSAQERNDVFKSAYFMLVEEHLEMMKELNAELEKEEKDESGLKVVTSGILADAPNLLSLFDKNEIRIVADDVAHESRQYRTDTPKMDNPLLALAHKFADMDNCSVLFDPTKNRPRYIVEQAKKHNAKGVVVLMTKFCDPEEFDYVPIKKECDKAGLAIVNIEVDRQMKNYEQAGTMLEAFKEML